MASDRTASLEVGSRIEIGIGPDCTQPRGWARIEIGNGPDCIQPRGWVRIETTDLHNPQEGELGFTQPIDWVRIENLLNHQAAPSQ